VLVDLLVILAVLALLSQLILPAMVRAKSRSQTLACLNNSKSLIAAWQMYQDDNTHVLIENYHGGDARGGTSARNPLRSPWASGWLDWGTSSDNTNVAFMVENRNSKLAKYSGNDAKIVKCPSDIFISLVQRNRGWSQRARSYSMNIGIGAGNAEAGPWSPIYIHAKKLSEIPEPSKTWVFIEEHPDSMNDPAFFNPTATTRLVDQPASFHDRGANVSFSDGHSETHFWKSSLSRYLDTRVLYRSGINAKVRGGDKDASWLSSRGGLANPDVWFGAPGN